MRDVCRGWPGRAGRAGRRGERRAGCGHWNGKGWAAICPSRLPLFTVPLCLPHTHPPAAYHHGEASLSGTIVGLAQDFVGSNNINYLVPQGEATNTLGGQSRHVIAEPGAQALHALLYVVLGCKPCMQTVHRSRPKRHRPLRPPPTS